MTCTKIPFATKRAALASAAGLSRRQFGGWRRGPFVKVYKCPDCPAWHMTRSKPRQKAPR